MYSFTANALLRKPAVLSLVGYSTTTLYDRINLGLFPKPIRIGARLSAWRGSEVVAVNDSIAAGKSDDELRAVVLAPEAARKEAPHA